MNTVYHPHARMHRGLIGAIAAVLFGSLFVSTFSGCTKSAAANSKATKPPLSVVVGTPVVMPIVEWDEFVARFAPIESVQVRARVSGYLASTHFEEGQIVRTGDIIAVVDQRPFQAEVSRNQANLAEAQAQLVQAKSAVSQAQAERNRAVIHRELAKKQFDRNDLLMKQNAISPQDFEISEAELAQADADVVVSNSRVESSESSVVASEAAVTIAQANLELANLNLQYTEVRAPITGRISSRYVTEGNLVSGGTNDSTLLTTIVSLDPIHCYFDADEQTFLKYTQLAREGKRRSSREVRNPVYVALSNERDGYPHQGHMDFVENRMDENTGTIRGRAILPNSNLELTPGLFARLRLPGSPRYDAVLIPDKAIGTDQAEKFVLTVDDKNTIVRKLVVLGPISHGLRIIRSGLDGTERVVLSGLQRARPGMEVNTTSETIQPGSEPLPDEYEPVPRNKWLTPKRAAAGNVAIPKEEPGNTSSSSTQSTSENENTTRDDSNRSGAKP